MTCFTANKNWIVYDRLHIHNTAGNPANEKHPDVNHATAKLKIKK